MSSSDFRVSIQVVADQPDMCEAVVGQPGGPPRVAAVGAHVFDDLENPVTVVAEAHDRGLHRRLGQQFAHVGPDGVAVHHVRRREHRESQHVAVERDRRLAVRDAYRCVCQARDHATDCGARAHSLSATHGEAVPAIDHARSAGTSITW